MRLLLSLSHALCSAFQLFAAAAADLQLTNLFSVLLFSFISVIST